MLALADYDSGPQGSSIDGEKVVPAYVDTMCLQRSYVEAVESPKWSQTVEHLQAVARVGILSIQTCKAVPPSNQDDKDQT